MRLALNAVLSLAVVLAACSPQAEQKTTLQGVMLEHGAKHAASSSPAADEDERPPAVAEEAGAATATAAAAAPP